MPREMADSVTLMTLLLPGTPILKLNDTLLAGEAFAKMVNARNVASFLYGETETSVINGTVFVYTRYSSSLLLNVFVLTMFTMSAHHFDDKTRSQPC